MNKTWLRTTRRIALALLWALCWGQAVAQQSDRHRHRNQAVAGAEGQPAQSVGQVSIPDIELLNQNGDRVRFHSDLVKGKTVVINTIFTSCTTICPPMGANFGKLQQLLGDRIGKDVLLISVSVDPVVDTPPRLKAWSSKFGAGPGWALLTGSKRQIDRLLKALKFFTPDKTDHSPTVLVGNESRGRWIRAYGLASPGKLAEVVESLLTDGGDK